MGKKLLCALLISAMVFTSTDISVFAEEIREQTEEMQEMVVEETEEESVLFEVESSGGEEQETDTIAETVETDETEISVETTELEETEYESMIFEENDTSLMEPTIEPREINKSYETSAIVASGQCGDNLIWELENGTLTISGTGKMWNYEYTEGPWVQYLSEETKLVIEEGVTEIGLSAFEGCENLTGSLIIPNSVEKILGYAFEGCKGFSGELIIPDSVTKIYASAFEDCSGFDGKLMIGKNVTHIYDRAFAGCSSFTGELEMPEELIYIGSWAFEGCNSLTGDLVIPNSVTEIEQGAFEDCSGFNGKLQIGDGLVEINELTFSNCSGFTEDLIIGKNVKKIKGSWMKGPFYGCAGKNVIIPDNVTVIEEGAFQQSKFTGDLVIGNGVVSIGNNAFDESTFSGTLTIGSSVKEIGSWAFQECSGFIGDLSIPDSVESIGGWAFDGCSGFNGIIKLSNNIIEIKDATFNRCEGLTGNLTIPNKVKSIGIYAFYNNKNLSGTLILPEGLEKIEGEAFGYCSGLTGDLIIPDSVNEIGEYAFENCSGFSGNLIIGNGINIIPKASFLNCSGFRGNLVLGNSVERIDTGTVNRYTDGAFEGCSGFTGDLIIPESVKVIDDVSFWGCSGFDGKLIIGKNVEYIGESAFGGCSGFTGDLIIPNSVIEIGESCFEGCSSLNGDLYIDKNVEKIGECAFAGCTGFTGDLTIGGKLTEIHRYFSYRNLEQQVTGACFDDLIINEGVTGVTGFAGVGFTGTLTLPSTLEWIGEEAFADNRFSGDLNIPENVTGLGAGAFYKSGFTGKLILNDNITSLQDTTDYHAYGTFEGCGFSGKFVIPDHLESIGKNTFRYCENITTLSVPAHIAQSAVFTGCMGLKKVEIRDSSVGSFETVNEYMFDGCVSLESVSLPDTLNAVGAYAFRNCDGLTDLDFLNSVKTIQYNAFRNCDGFINLDFPDSVVTIGSRAFQGCSSVRNIILPRSVESIGGGTFRDCNELQLIQTNCSEDALTRVADEEGRTFNADSITIIYADDQPSWEYVDTSYGITNAITISYSEYMSSEGASPSEISIPQNCFGLCAVDSSTGKLIRDAVITLDDITYETDLSGVLLVRRNVESAQHIVSARAVNYYTNGNNYYTTQLGVLTCIEMQAIENIGGNTGADVTVESGLYAIYAIDKSTGKIINDIEVSIDGNRYQIPSDGILYVEANNSDISEHTVIVSAPDGYCAYPYQSVVFTSGGKLEIPLEPLDDHNISYISGVLNDGSEGTIWIDQQSYVMAEDLILSDIMSLKGKTVIGKLRDGILVKVEDISHCLTAQITVEPANANDDFCFMYQNGKYSKKEIDFWVTIKCAIDSTYPEGVVSNGNNLSIDVSEINLILDHNSGFQLSQNKIEVGRTILLDENNSFTFNASIKLTSDSAPTQIIRTEDLRIKVTCNTGTFASSVKLNTVNVDMKQAQMDSAREEAELKKNNSTNSEVKNTLQNSILFNLSGTVLETQYFTQEQLDAIEELLTLWMTNIDASTDTARTMSNDERFVKKVLKKFGVNINTWFSLSDTTAQIKIKANTKEYGNRTFCFVVDIQNYHWNDESPFGKFGTMEWYVEETDGIESRYHSGTCAMIAIADPEKLITQLRDLAIDSIKEVYDEVWGNDADKVAEEMLDKRILALIDEKYDSTSDMVFTLLLDASKSSVKSGNRTKTITKCPVDLYIYDSLGNLAGTIINNKAYSTDNGVLVYMEGESKVVVYYGDEYTVKFVGTDIGTMSHEIYEYRDSGECVRTLEFEDVPLERDTVYYESIPDRLFATSKVYEIISEDGESILPDSDTHVNKELIYVNDVYIEPENLTMRLGETQTLKAVIEPANASTKYVKWLSDNDDIVSVTADGVISATGEGVVTVCAVSVDGKIKGNCTITVKKKVTEPETVTYTVTFNSNGGSEVPAQTVEENQKAKAPEEPTRKGYIFKGWYFGDKLYDFDNLVTADVTLEARWEIDESKKQGDVLPEDIPSDGIIPNGIWSAGITDKTYTASAIKQSFRVYDGTKLLKEKTDYTISYKNNKNAYIYLEEDYAAFAENFKNTGKKVKTGTFDPTKAPQVIIKMKGNYSGSKTIYYKIEQVDISGDGFETADLTVTYTGKKQTPKPTLIWNGKKLKYGTDFCVPEYDNAKNDKKAFTEPQSEPYKLTITGRKNFAGEIPITLTISESAKQIAMNKVTVKGIKNLPWTGEPLTQTGFTVRYNKDILSEENGDYTISWGSNTDVGTATVTFTGTGADTDEDGFSYIGSKTISFKIAGTSMNKVTVSGVDKSYTYTGNEIKPVAILTYKANKNAEPITLLEGTHYTTSYQKNVEKGTATIVFTGLASGGYTGTKKQTFKITSSGIGDTTDGENAIEKVKITFKEDANIRDGIYIAPYMKGGAKPEVIVTSGDKTLQFGKDYTVSYSNNKNVALSTEEKAPSITVTGKGNYTGSKTVYFTIEAKTLSNENGITVVAKDKVESAKKNGYRQSFKVYDADGKALGSKDYDSKNATYTLIQTTNEDGTVNTVNEVLDN